MKTPQPSSSETPPHGGKNSGQQSKAASFRALRLGLLGAMAIAGLAMAAPPSLAPGTVTTGALLAEMNDLTAITRFPSPAFSTRQASSYDRASVAPDKPGWFANGDSGQYVRSEQHAGRTEHVMMESSGPGAIVRLWSANPSGTLRLYLDGSEAPVLEGELARLLNASQDSDNPALVPPPLAVGTSRGFNLYFPIPFARGCKVTVEGGDSGHLYYAVDYRTYAPGTPVQSFERAQLESLRPQIERAARDMSTPGGNDIWPQQIQRFDSTVAAGASVVLADVRGQQAITQFLLRVAPGTSEQSLRALVLRMSFDGAQTVEVPLGDFFGTAPGQSPFQTLPLAISESHEMSSRWVMPFRQSARVQVLNKGAEAVRLGGQIGASAYRWTPASMVFHAGFRSRYDLPTRPMSDMNVLRAEGQGVFVGQSYAIDNPSTKWWGEGDEKVWVDGESFPSWFGTGSEDYFGYAWCDTAEFSHAFHSQPRADGPGACGPGRGHWGRASNNRFHIFDRIPFTKSLSFNMELSHWVETKVNVATVAYWYAKPLARDDFTPLQSADLQLRPIPPYQAAPVIKGAVEGEAMAVLQGGAQASLQNGIPEGLSAGSQLWWHEGVKVGDRLALGFDAPQAGTYRVFGRFVKARDYGTMQLAINGQKAGAPIDFYNSEVLLAGEIELGTFALKVGRNEFSATVTGANAQAEKNYMLGLDYLRLQPAP